MRFIYILIILSFPAYVNAYYASYYEKYNPTVKQLSNTPYARHINFFIQSGKLRADGIVYTLSGASDINLDQKTLKEHGLQTVIIKIGNRYYKATPSFKKLLFIKKGKKGIFRYTVGKELILVYVPYADKMQVIGVISQGQFIQENRYKKYDLNINKEIKKQILLKIFNMLGCKQLRDCNVKSDKDGNNYFYKDNKLIGMLENFGNEKILIQKRGDDEKHIATIKKYGNKILMEDVNGNIIYQSDNSKNIDIPLKTLGYEMELKIN